jgi:hypothetical protein
MDINKLVSIALPIIFSNEGNYGSVNKDDNGAVSIGKIQWHGNRALNLLKRIIKANDKPAQLILGQALYKEIKKSKDWGHRKVDSVEARLISSFISASFSKAIQDQQAMDDVAGYIKAGQKLGLLDGKTLIYFADCYNQSPASAVRIARDAIKRFKKPSYVDLNTYHACALIDEVMQNHKPRRITVYNKLKDYELYNKPTKTITVKSYENDICWLQDKLNSAFKALNSPTRLEVDGIYGQGVIKAVCEFYKLQGWKSDGCQVGIYAIGRLSKY